VAGTPVGTQKGGPVFLHLHTRISQFLIILSKEEGSAICDTHCETAAGAHLSGAAGLFTREVGGKGRPCPGASLPIHNSEGPKKWEPLEFIPGSGVEDSRLLIFSDSLIIFHT
jgi:hypothetical protein